MSKLSKFNDSGFGDLTLSSLGTTATSSAQQQKQQNTADYNRILASVSGYGNTNSSSSSGNRSNLANVNDLQSQLLKSAPSTREAEQLFASMNLNDGDLNAFRFSDAGGDILDLTSKNNQLQQQQFLQQYQMNKQLKQQDLNMNKQSIVGQQHHQQQHQQQMNQQMNAAKHEFVLSSLFF